MVQWVKRPTLGFGSGHDLTVREFKPLNRLCAVTAQSLLGILFLSLSAPPALSLSLSLKINNLKKNKMGTWREYGNNQRLFYF